MNIQMHIPATIETLGPSSAGKLMSPKEFMDHDRWEEGSQYELIHGVLVVSPGVASGEADPNDELAYLLRKYRYEHAQGACLDGTRAEAHIQSANDVRRADRVIFVNLGRVPNFKQDIPTIVVEFVSYGRRNFNRDYVEKRDEFLALGIKEYWVIDRFDHTMSVFTGTVKSPQQRVLQATEDYTTPLLPGFVLPLNRLLNIADQHSHED